VRLPFNYLIGFVDNFTNSIDIYSIMLYQVEFLIKGYLLPITVGEFRVSENFLIEKVSPKHLRYEQTDYAIAYVAVDAPKDSYYFHIAINYLDFFLLVHSLMSGQPITSRIGIGTPLKNISSLGKKRFTFGDYEKIHMLSEPSDYFLKPFIKLKERFLELLPFRKKIMENPLKIVLVYYYWAVQASQRRFEEAFINLMIAAEALLIIEDRKKRSLLSRRLSALVANEEEEKIIIAKTMLNLYDLRSAIVHGGGKKPSINDLKTLFGYVQKGINNVLSSKEFSKENLIRKLDTSE
jgi:hypothetical protein